MHIYVIDEDVHSGIIGASDVLSIKEIGKQAHGAAHWKDIDPIMI